jgi:hypothetical protein
MRCYFMSNGHIAGVEVLTVASDDDAIKQARALFQERSQQFAGFEVWDRSRPVYRYPAHGSDPLPTSNGGDRKPGEWLR